MNKIKDKRPFPAAESLHIGNAVDKTKIKPWNASHY